MIHARIASGIANIGTVRIREAAGLAILKALWIRTTSGIANYLASLSAVPTPGYVSGYASIHAPVQVITDGVIISVSGGSGSYTAAWAGLGGWTALNPTSLSTAFRSPPIGPGDSSSETQTCTVTDTVTGVAVTVDIIANAQNFGN